MPFTSSAQHLTISTSGEAGTSGTNWSISGNTLTASNSGNSNIHPSVIQNHLASNPLTVYAGSVIFNANITSSTANNLSIWSNTHITNTSATSITTQGGNVLFASNVDDATDGEATTNGYIQLRFGITINSNGGNITFGGGNTSGTDYALGSSVEAYTEGIRFDEVIALNSGGGNISLRGKSYAMGVQLYWGAAGVGFYYFSGATGTINSGTGTITIDGFSQTNTSTYASGIYSQHNMTITSANTTADAIRLIGKATGASGEAWGIESEGTLSVLATGIGGGITISTSKQLIDNSEAVYRGETNILAVSGPINILTGQLGGTTNGYLYLAGYMYLGSKAGSAVTNSSSNINIQVDRYYYANFVVTRLATSGSVTIQPNATSFGADTYTSWFNFNENGQTMTNFTFGKSGNATNVYLNTVFTVAGPIKVYGGTIALDANLTTTNNGAISLYSDNPLGLGASRTVTAAGSFNYIPQSNIFAAEVTYPISNLNVSSTGLLIGKSTNTANITFANTTTVAGPITAYGGTITLNANLTTTNNGDISLYTDNALGGLTTTARTITAAGSFNYIPRSDFFSVPVTYPITNLNVSSAGLLIGKPTNTANITFANTTTINGPITVYGGTLAVNQNVASSAGSTISLYGNVLNFASGKTVTSSGLLIVAPQNSAGSIGMGGSTGTLQLPASYFSTNLTDGFSLIQIGTNSHSSAIASNAFNLRDNMALYTTGSVTLGGKPVLGVNNLTLGSAISSISSGATNYFKTNGTGRVFRNIPNGSNLIFPIGRAIYNPVTIKNNSGAADDFSALVLDSVFLNGTTGPLITTPHVKVTWDISKTNANNGSGIDFEFGWDLSQEVGTFTSYKLNHHSSTWAFAAGTSQTPSGTTIKGMSHTGYSGTFSPFAISEGAYALPVELISFNANCISNETKIEWQTASEHNTSHFVVERSFEGTKWEKLGEVTAAGNSTSILNYSFIDTALGARALTYYRLEQLDIDGKSETFGPVSSDCAIEYTSIGLQPNPCATEVTLSIASQIPTEVNYTLISPEGKVLETKQIAVHSGITLYTFDVSHYPSGMYMMRFDVNDKRFIKKLTVQ